jgi:SNF family Na+-dependent transporter
MGIVVVLGFAVCSFGLQKGIEKITKYMMLALLVLIIVLAVYSISSDKSGEGLKFYLLPDFDKMMDAGILNVLVAAMSQAFFTLSIGIGNMAIFGSYIGKDRSLMGEAVNVAALDTFVAFTSGLIIFPACFAFNVEPGAGPGLVFVTLPSVFEQMPLGQLWCSLFFVFMSFAALSTIIAVFENIIAFAMDEWGISRGKSVAINGVLLIVLSLPCALGFNIWSDFVVPGIGDIQSIEDFILSNNILPLGSLVICLFCTSKLGWGWDGFIAEADATLEGKGRSRGDSLGHGAFYSGSDGAPADAAAEREQTVRSVADELAQLPPEEVQEVLASLEEEMTAAAASMDFERAAQLRDQVVALRGALEGESEEDVIARLKRTDRKGSAHATRRRYRKHKK